jgi:hypothetical protein
LQFSDSRVSDLHPADSTYPASQATSRGVVFGLPAKLVMDGQHGSTASERVTHVVVDRGGVQL